ncbi:isoprenylcysteine alpha-carbonyl methylesterase ICME-like [Primulina tabacum]|uniref:isoprenylcysteine alpha-carbonyl methylesterase ICME-like n=1 Tax=Primulina tabacum TaxID=48773 RepID=UPI003F5A33D1
MMGYMTKIFYSSLNIYLAKNSDGPKPVVAFVTGGAWIIDESSAERLQSLGVQAQCILYEGKNTDLFVQDPMRGGRDDMFEWLRLFNQAESARSHGGLSA